MKTFAVIAAIGTFAATTPALADSPAGIRVEALAGYDKVSLDLNSVGLGTYSRDGIGFALNVGYDMPVSESVSVGFDAEVGESTSEYSDQTIPLKITTGRDLYVGGRISAAINPKFSLYGKVGYTNTRLTASSGAASASDNGDGVRLGIGAQLGFSGPVYGLVEYRYSNYEADFSRNQVLAGVGVRF